MVDIYNLNYYWFVGYSDITASHFRREYLDLKDRLLHGYNQRWAYVTVAATVTKKLAPFGRDGEAQTDKMVQTIITQVYPRHCYQSRDRPAAGWGVEGIGAGEDGTAFDSCWQPA